MPNFETKRFPKLVNNKKQMFEDSTVNNGLFNKLSEMMHYCKPMFAVL